MLNIINNFVYNNNNNNGNVTFHSDSLTHCEVLQYLPPPLEITGVVRMSRSEICEDSLVLAAVCCCTLTSAASAKCMSVFLSGLSSKFLQPIHLQMDEHMIFAFKMKHQII